MSTDKFDNVPRIVLDKEDREAFQRGRNAKPGKTPEIETDASASSSSAPTKSGNGGWIFLTLMVALGGYGANYWLFQQNQQQLQMLGKAEQRIEDLERKISATGEELDQSAVALRVQVNELKDKSEVLWQEMDKLWASAWRRNQSEIQDLSESVTKSFRQQKQTLTGLENDVSLTGTNLAVIQEQVDQQKAQVDQQKAQVNQLSNTVSNALKNSSNSEQEIKQLTDQIATSALRIEALADRINQLEQLKQKVEALSSQRSTPPPSSQPTATIKGAAGAEQSLNQR